MNRTVVRLILLYAILVSGVTISAITLVKQNSSSEASVFVSPSGINVRVTQTFQVNINVSAISGLYGWEFKLGYNTSLLEIVNIDEGSFLNSSGDTYFVPKVMSTDGYILAGCTSLRNVAGVSGNGTLATVEFRAKKTGSCTLDLYDTKLVNSAKQLIEHSETDGTVTASGRVIIKVQYKDGYPRSGADVLIRIPSMYLGATNETGQVEVDFLNPGDYTIFAVYELAQFGPDTYLGVDENGDGSATITKDWEITPPVIDVFSPLNQTYLGRNVPLTYTIYDYSPISWTGYSLNEQANKTLNENTTLNLSKGSYSIAVYSNDIYGNMGSSGTICFTVQGGCVTIRVQYLDGSPRSEADVRTEQGFEFPPTDENGLTSICGYFSPGHYYVNAYWPPSIYFAGPTDLDVDENGNGYTVIQKNVEITPPAIEVLSPQNLTYTNGSVPLTFTIYDYSSISWIGYSLDNQSNTTITGNTTLTVEDGTHRIVVYANDSFGNMGCSQIVHFTIGEHDIAVANITLSKTIVGQAYSTSIKVIVENQGDRPETFNVTLYANTTSIATQTITLTSGNSTTVTFTWNTTGFAKGNYTISAIADTILGETDTTDNTFTDRWVVVTMVGDLTGGTASLWDFVPDGKVDGKDLSVVSKCFGSWPGAPPPMIWHPNCDINDDDKIDGKDRAIGAKHFGESDP